MRKVIILFLLIGCIAVNGYAQLVSANIGVNGLHCSACSYGTEKSLRKLDFVRDVKMDLNAHLAEITFKEGTQPDIAALVQKIYDAGFSVRSVYVIFNFKGQKVSSDFCYKDSSYTFHFVNVKEQALDGLVPLHVIGDRMMPKSELNKWKPVMDKGCPGTESSSPHEKVYTVTL